MGIQAEAELIDINEDFLDLVLLWRNQEDIRKVMYHDKLITIEEHRSWFNSINNSEKKITKVFLFKGAPYGVVNITNIDRINQRCEWGFYIGEKNAPRGLGSIMGNLALNYMFKELRLNKICSEVLGFNQASLHFHRKLGFNQEGLLKNHIIKNGKYIDVYLFAKFNNS
ncbi:UDP-4-amino-4,6-dideoxy-N-acetyl-beta-L-altrosamine N-acetyltransferase [Rossellomorea sp. LjRoot5]|uniref:UDP-4-amino-4, 6-dideoxy-N-acetyl-beta-L-altrosamine N-acetyltransferase n=1 Tax=Rossellomorea sp. LjRoot5 TaxID=3342331 RepID=UPI003ED036A0